MTTLTAIQLHTAPRTIRTHAPARPAGRTGSVFLAADAIPAALRRFAPAAGVAAGAAGRFGLALLPVSALAGMFAWL